MTKITTGKTAINLFGLVLAPGLLLATSTVQAQSSFDFACNNGELVEVSGIEGVDSGWGNAQHLVDNVQWSVWANNYNVYNPSQSSASVTVNLQAAGTIGQIGLYESQFSPATGYVDVELMDSSGTAIDANGSSPGTAVRVDVLDGAQSKWHMSAPINVSGVSSVKLVRDAPTDNVAELKLCSGGEPPLPTLSVADLQVSEGDSAGFIVTSSAPASGAGITFDFQVVHIDTQANDLTGETTGSVIINSGQSSASINIQIVQDNVDEVAETFKLLLSNATTATIADGEAIATISGTDNGTCQYSAMSVPQDCLPESLQAPDILKSATFDNWRAKIDGGVAGYGSSSSNESCADLHDRYWVKGDDDKAYHTWHPAKVSGCAFHHEHGTNPAESDIFQASGGYPPFGFAMEMQHHYAMANGGAHHKRHEDHVGHKVVVANNIRLAIGKSQEFNSDIYESGITCDWFSKIHQGSSTADAMTNHLHEYFLNVRCDDYDSAGVATEFSVKTLTQWGRMNELDSDTHERKTPYKNAGNTSEKCARPAGSPPGKDNYGDVCSELTMPWNGAPDYVAAAHLRAPNNGLGSRDFALFPSVQYKEWSSSIAHGGKVTFPELWSGPAGKRLETLGGTIKFAPYYTIKNPARMLVADSSSHKYLLKRTVDLCYAGGVGSARVQGEFCSILPATKQSVDFWKSPESAFNGTIRAMNFKGLELRNEGGAENFCTNPFGYDASPLNGSGRCGVGHIAQQASLKTNYWQSQSSGSGNPCVRDINQTCHNINLDGTIERWTLDFDKSAGKWIAQQSTAQHVGGAHYRGAGMGFEWIINGNDDDNDIGTGSTEHHDRYGVRVPN